MSCHHSLDQIEGIVGVDHVLALHHRRHPLAAACRAASTSTASCFWVTGRGTVTDWAVDGGGGGGGEGGRERRRGRRRRLRRTAQAVTQGSPEGKQPLLPAQTLCCPSSSRGGRLTSLDASFARFFSFCEEHCQKHRRRCHCQCRHCAAQALLLLFRDILVCQFRCCSNLLTTHL